MSNHTVTALLRSLGIPAHIKGYRYIQDAIALLQDNPSMIEAITTQLYPNVARRQHTTPSRAERAIRHAISISWQQEDKAFLQNIFAVVPCKKPTNGQFLATLFEALQRGDLIESKDIASVLLYDSETVNNVCAAIMSGEIPDTTALSDVEMRVIISRLAGVILGLTLKAS